MTHRKPTRNQRQDNHFWTRLPSPSQDKDGRCCGLSWHVASCLLVVLAVWVFHAHSSAPQSIWVERQVDYRQESGKDGSYYPPHAHIVPDNQIDNTASDDFISTALSIMAVGSTMFLSLFVAVPMIYFVLNSMTART